jgi:hypothetical protein
MTRSMIRIALAAAVSLTAVTAFAQTTSTTSETKTFEILAVDGNSLVVKLPEGTREMTVPSDFRFTVNGKQLSVLELKAGMKGTATVTTRTTVTPVTVTEVKNGTVMSTGPASIIVRTDEGFKQFSQDDIDKRGVKIMRAGKPAVISDFRNNDRLTATIITSKPPHVMTQQEVDATHATAKPARGSSGSGGTRPASGTAASSGSSASGATGGARTLPKTASAWPSLGLASALLIAFGLALTVRRRIAV